MGAINKDRINFLCELGRRLTQSTDDHRESAFPIQRLSVLLQRIMWSLYWVYLHPHNPPSTKCSRSSICSSF